VANDARRYRQSWAKESMACGEKRSSLFVDTAKDAVRSLSSLDGRLKSLLSVSDLIII
jgi:hypothetical protein